MERWLERFAAINLERAPDVAHDLKTPLNIAVLNLELLRMRVQKLVGGPDEKLNEYARAIDQELRRMARIFDAYFVYAVPPREGPGLGEIAPDPVLRPLVPPAWEFAAEAGAARVAVHEPRLRELFKLVLEAAAKIFSPTGLVLGSSISNGTYQLRLRGTGSGTEPDLGKLFKFYYTDASGNPDIAFATARLICETYGGSLTIWDENGSRLVLDLQLPLADHRSES